MVPARNVSEAALLNPVQRRVGLSPVDHLAFQRDCDKLHIHFLQHYPIFTGKEIHQSCACLMDVSTYQDVAPAHR